MSDQRRTLYPPSEPFEQKHLRVSPTHEIYYQQFGNPDGPAVLFVHGGPGGGCGDKASRFFDPDHYRIVLFDQRGCGLSRPHANLEENTTWDLVADMERLRELLKIERWLVFGGSWGSTLALAYAQRHPARVKGLVLRGIFLARQREIRWLYQFGASELFPDAWESFLAPIPADEHDDLLTAYHKRLSGDDASIALEAAAAWSIWEGSTSFLIVNNENVARCADHQFALALARIECHYFVNGAFFEVDDQLLRDVGKLRQIPGVIVQGRYDVVCPVRSAWDLHRAWPEAELRIVPDAGHSAYEVGIISELVEATDKFRGLE